MAGGKGGGRQVDICGKSGGSVDMVIHMALRIFSHTGGREEAETA